MRNEVGAKKRAFLQIFVIVTPKEGLVGPCQSFFWYDTDCRFVICSLHKLLCTVGVIPNEGSAGPHQQILLLVWE